MKNIIKTTGKIVFLLLVGFGIFYSTEQSEIRKKQMKAHGRAVQEFLNQNDCRPDSTQVEDLVNEFKLH